MNKTELINAVAAKTGLSKKNADQAVAAVLDAITASLKDGEKVSLVGFGTFDVKKRLERTVVNPSTGKRMLVPPKLVLNFKPVASIKEKLKNGGEDNG